MRATMPTTQPLPFPQPMPQPMPPVQPAPVTPQPDAFFGQPLAGVTLHTEYVAKPYADHTMVATSTPSKTGRPVDKPQPAFQAVPSGSFEDALKAAATLSASHTSHLPNGAIDGYAVTAIVHDDAGALYVTPLGPNTRTHIVHPVASERLYDHGLNRSQHFEYTRLHPAVDALVMADQWVDLRDAPVVDPA